MKENHEFTNPERPVHITVHTVSKCSNPFASKSPVAPTSLLINLTFDTFTTQARISKKMVL